MGLAPRDASSPDRQAPGLAPEPAQVLVNASTKEYCSRTLEFAAAAREWRTGAAWRRRRISVVLKCATVTACATPLSTAQERSGAAEQPIVLDLAAPLAVGPRGRGRRRWWCPGGGDPAPARARSTSSPLFLIVRSPAPRRRPSDDQEQELLTSCRTRFGRTASARGSRRSAALAPSALPRADGGTSRA